MNRDNISKGISETFNVPVEQQKFVRDYSINKSNSTSYEPNSGIYQPEKINGFNQNRNEYYNIFKISRNNKTLKA